MVRGFADDVTDTVRKDKSILKYTHHSLIMIILKVEEIRGKQLLTRFQQQKFRHFFYHVLDLNSDHVISQEDFDGLNDRVRHYMDWSVNTLYFLALREVSSNFLAFSDNISCRCIAFFWSTFS